MWSDFAASDILNRLPYNLQGHNVILEEKFKLRTNKLFSEEDEFPRTLLERWQGPPNTHKVKQYEIVLSLVPSICLFSCIQSPFPSDEYLF